MATSVGLERPASTAQETPAPVVESLKPEEMQDIRVSMPKTSPENKDAGLILAVSDRSLVRLFAFRRARERFRGPQGGGDAVAERSEQGGRGRG